MSDYPLVHGSPTLRFALSIFNSIALLMLQLPVFIWTERFINYHSRTFTFRRGIKIVESFFKINFLLLDCLNEIYFLINWCFQLLSKMHINWNKIILRQLKILYFSFFLKITWKTFFRWGERRGEGICAGTGNPAYTWHFRLAKIKFAYW